MPASLDLLFRPKTVAVIGASQNPNNLGHRIVSNLTETGFPGAIYPVHPRGGSIKDLHVYRSIEELPHGVSLAVVCVPRQAVLGVIDQCASARVGVIIIVSAGFAEMDAVGADLQQALATRARVQGLRLVGPNCVGVINTDRDIRLNTTFCPLSVTPGAVALCSQSGALGVLALAKGDSFNVGFSQFISVGNEADVATAELVEYWGEDDRTAVILLYLESIKHGERFREAALRISRAKPIVAIKAGRDEAGLRAAQSHTAALTSNELAIEALFHQTGIVRATGLDELLDLAAVLGHQPMLPGRRVGIVTNAGGPAVLCTDACAQVGLEVPVLSTELQHQMAQFIAPPASVANPVDMLASAGPAEYRQAVEMLLGCNELDAVVVIYVPVEMVANSKFVKAICAGVVEARSQATDKRPIVACVMSKTGERIRLTTPTETIPCCVTPDAVARVLGKVERYARWRRQPRGSFPRFDDADFEKARSILSAAGHVTDGWLSTSVIHELAGAMGWPAQLGTVAMTSSEAVQAALRVGFPVVLKTASARILHKTDVGAVELDLRKEKEVQAAFERVQSRVAAHDETAASAGVLVQPMYSGVELFIGATRDPQFGPLLAFGLGGTRVEIVRDVCHRLAPLTDREAYDLVRSIRGYPLLAGYRGQPPADVPAIEQMLLRVSQFVAELSQVVELDLNPVFATQGCRIVDARIQVQQTI